MNKVNASLLITLIIGATYIMYMNQDSQKSSETLFGEWKGEHGLMLNLSPEEQIYRLSVFKQNLEEINEHNSKLGKTYTKGVNKFTGYTQEQFASMFLTTLKPNVLKEDEVKSNVQINIDWVSYGAVSPAKNEGSCLASYAFSAIGGIEGISVIFYNTRQEYSAQQVVDCSVSFGNSGCNGGTMENSFNYITKVGINTENAYPYVGEYGSCRATAGIFKIIGYNKVNSCSQLDFALAGRPISVGVDGRNFRSYSGGIFDNCGITISLGALLVGATDSFYRLKLSWGINFGQNGGYIRIVKSYNVCGICSFASYPVPA